MTAEKAELVTTEQQAPAQMPSGMNSEISTIMQVVERVALNPDADMGKLEKLLDMQERVLDRNARMEYDSALADMQSELPEVEKTAQGHNSMYAKFEHVLVAIKPYLKKYGFSITHRVNVQDKLIHITAVLSHRGGHREETTIALPADTSGGKNAVQAVASSTEYGRRYTMNSLLGIATKNADKDGGTPEQLSSTALDWIAKVKESATMADLEKTYKEAYKALGQQERKELIKAKDAKKKQLQGGAR